LGRRAACANAHGPSEDTPLWRRQSLTPLYKACIYSRPYLTRPYLTCLSLTRSAGGGGSCGRRPARQRGRRLCGQSPTRDTRALAVRSSRRTTGAASRRASRRVQKKVYISLSPYESVYKKVYANVNGVSTVTSTVNRHVNVSQDPRGFPSMPSAPAKAAPALPVRVPRAACIPCCCLDQHAASTALHLLPSHRPAQRRRSWPRREPSWLPHGKPIRRCRTRCRHR
jgi:hypothetical protein